jgi:hypothetical protein
MQMSIKPIAQLAIGIGVLLGVGILTVVAYPVVPGTSTYSGCPVSEV